MKNSSFQFDFLVRFVSRPNELKRKIKHLININKIPASAGSKYEFKRT